MDNTLIKTLIKNITIGLATGGMLAACGGGSDTSSQAKLLIDTNSVKISIPAANVTASSTDTTNVPGNAVDGNLGTHWTGGAASGNQWIQFKLPACYTADYAKISWYNGDQRQYTYTIEGSANNGATWTPIKTVTSDGTSAALVQVDFPQTAANMLRISSSGSNVSTKVSLNDIEFWGLSGASCTPTTTTTTKTTTTTTAGSGLNPGLPPGGNFNLAGWQLQLPTGTTGKMDQVEGTTLEAGYTKKPYFYTDTSDGSMVLMDPAVGIASSGSLHPRSELREYAQWYTTTPSTLSATLKVTKVIGSTTIAQIFQGTGPLKPLCELQFSASSVHLFLENSNQGGQGGPTTVITTVPLGQKFSYKMTYVGNKITVTVDGVTKTFTSDPSFNGEKFFFKAGNYNQSATNGTPQTTDGTVVKFYSLSTTH